MYIFGGLDLEQGQSHNTDGTVLIYSPWWLNFNFKEGGCQISRAKQDEETEEIIVSLFLHEYKDYLMLCQTNNMKRGFYVMAGPSFESLILHQPEALLCSRS